MIEELYAEHGVAIVPLAAIRRRSAVLDLLARAPTARTAAILLDQAERRWHAYATESTDTPGRA